MNALDTSHENVIDALANEFMTNGFRDMLDRVWAAHETVIPVRYLEVAYTSEKRPPAVFDRLPCVEMVSGREETTTESSAEILVHRVSAVFTDIGDDEEILARVLRRFVRATRLYFKDFSLIPYVANAPVVIGAADYSPLAQVRNREGIVQSVGVELLVTTFA